MFAFRFAFPSLIVMLCLGAAGCCTTEEEIVTETPPAEALYGPTSNCGAPLPSNVLFDPGKAALKPEGMRVTDEVIARLKLHPADTVRIEGHTSAEGTDRFNLELGQRRADAVKKYMVENGIAAERITTQSFGESQPADTDATEQGKRQNRRAVFQITIGQMPGESAP